jgi:hypothetical protein
MVGLWTVLFMLVGGADPASASEGPQRTDGPSVGVIDVSHASRAAAAAPVALGAPGAAPTLANPAGNRRPWALWVSGGLYVAAAIGGQDASAGRLELAAAKGRHLLSFRYTYVEDTNGACGDIICLSSNVSLPRDAANEFALQYGVRRRAPYTVLTASAGAALLWTVQRGTDLQSMTCFFGCVYQYNTIKGHAVGGTAEFGAYLSSRFISFGPTFVADFNTIQSFWGILLDLHLGWMGEPMMSF